MSKNNNNFFTFFCLYIAPMIAINFFTTFIPVMMRNEKYSLSAIGLLHFLSLPLVLKFLWSPAIDRTCVTVNHYKRWIFISELLFAILLFAIAFFHFLTSFYTVLVLVFISFAVSTTQGIATDALATQVFDRKDKSKLNSMHLMGNFGGRLIGTGILLLIFQYIGWNNILFFLFLSAIIALLPLYFNRGLTINREQSVAKQVSLKDIFRFFTQGGDIWKQVGFLILYHISMIGTLAMLRPYLVDLKYSFGQIGMMNGIVGAATGLVASFIGGLIIQKIGRHRSRILFAIFMVVTALYIFLISKSVHPSMLLLYIGVIMIGISYGTSAVVLYTLAMDRVRKGREGTDFTIQLVIAQLSGITFGALSGVFAQRFGYSNLFLVEFGFACLALFYILIVFRKKVEEM